MAELNYVNVIEPCDYWKGPNDTSDVIPRFRLPVPETEEMDPADFQQVTSQRLATDLSLLTTVRTGRSPTDLTKPVLIIEYRAIGLVTDANDIDSWFLSAHEAIGLCFKNMTSADIQKNHWQEA